jgi:hypothetical protein
MILNNKIYLIYFCQLLYVLSLYILSLNNKSIIIIHRCLGFKFIIYMIIGNKE